MPDLGAIYSKIGLTHACNIHGNQCLINVSITIFCVKNRLRTPCMLHVLIVCGNNIALKIVVKHRLQTPCNCTYRFFVAANVVATKIALNSVCRRCVTPIDFFWQQMLR